MDTRKIADYIVSKKDGLFDEAVVQAEWVQEGQQGFGAFKTPDGKIWLIRGYGGNPHEEENMFFTDISENPLKEFILQRAREGHRVIFHSHWKRWETSDGRDLKTLQSNY